MGYQFSYPWHFAGAFRALKLRYYNYGFDCSVINVTLLPTLKDQQWQRTHYIILPGRILGDYFDALTPLKDAVIIHIPHKYTNEIARKSKKVTVF